VATMLAGIFHENGGPEVLRVEEVPRPEPGPGEVRVRVAACGLNHLDLWIRRGLPIDTTMPHIGGSDVAGVVESIGNGVSGFEGGERVVVNPSLWCGRCRECLRGEQSLCDRYRILGEHTDGGFAEFVAVPAHNVYRIPDDYGFEAAAALPISYQTAWRALIGRASLRAGEDVLVLGASGGTAAAAVQIAKLAGARVFAVTSGASNVERVRALGADFVFDRHEVDFSREVFAATRKRGVDVVVENVGEATWKGSVRALAKGGRLVTYGATTGHACVTDLRLLFWKQLQIIGTTMANVAEFEAMLTAAFRRDFEPVVDTVLPLDSIAEAHRRLEAGEQFGKVVIRVGADDA
jgi:NADPH:quinone reductase-like Zn-dependent oxidoreductase